VPVCAVSGDWDGMRERMGRGQDLEGWGACEGVGYCFAEARSVGLGHVERVWFELNLISGCTDDC
jgi:hypothetical protein